MDKIAKLSTAIRIGATFRPQCVGYLFWYGKSCALGAAYEALTGENLQDHSKWSNVDPLLRERFGVSNKLLGDVTMLNDKCHMTREQIADHLEAQGL